MSSIITYTDINFIKTLESSERLDAIEELARVFEESGIADNISLLIQALKEREEIMSTGIGFGIAIPHVKISSVKEMAFAIGISGKGIDFASMDDTPVHLVILVVAGEKQHKEYLKLLSSIMSVLKNEEVRNSIIQSGNPAEIIDILNSRK